MDSFQAWFTSPSLTAVTKKPLFLKLYIGQAVYHRFTVCVPSERLIPAVSTAPSRISFPNHILCPDTHSGLKQEVSKPNNPWDQLATNLFCSETDRKYFRLVHPGSLQQELSAVTCCESSLGGCINEGCGCVPVQLHLQNWQVSGFGSRATFAVPALDAASF